LRSLRKIAGYEAGSESVGQRYGSTDPDLYQNVKDPEHRKRSGIQPFREKKVKHSYDGTMFCFLNLKILAIY
jgi:hypothetical protein